MIKTTTLSPGDVLCNEDTGSVYLFKRWDTLGRGKEMIHIPQSADHHLAHHSGSPGVHLRCGVFLCGGILPSAHCRRRTVRQLRPKLTYENGSVKCGWLCTLSQNKTPRGIPATISPGVHSSAARGIYRKAGAMPGQRARFEVFKRDGFTCQYCGATPPAAVLQVDHIDPKSKGGSNDQANLITACFDCNIGKSDKSLDEAMPTLAAQTEDTKERELQLSEFRKWKSSAAKRAKRDINALARYWRDVTGHDATVRFRDDSLAMFASKLDLDDIKKFMAKSASMYPDDVNRALRYFCGCCWNRIKRRKWHG